MTDLLASVEWYLEAYHAMVLVLFGFLIGFLAAYIVLTWSD